MIDVTRIFRDEYFAFMVFHNFLSSRDYDEKLFLLVLLIIFFSP
jgi:hypothetical protein